ncbi:MAG: hypothetical protein KY467_12575 [Gemmatimonadetes bacterium]|nr:hypothetical protein [Gemmatimonadota bacterium]
MREELRLMKLRAAVLLARSREARARATRALEHARLLRGDSADLRQQADELRESKRPDDP